MASAERAPAPIDGAVCNSRVVGARQNAISVSSPSYEIDRRIGRGDRATATLGIDG